VPYRIELSERAQRRLGRIEPRSAERIREAIDGLAGDPRPPGTVALSGFIPRAYRIRIGDFRVVFLIEDDTQTVFVIEVGHRRDVYRGLSR